MHIPVHTCVYFENFRLSSLHVELTSLMILNYPMNLVEKQHNLFYFKLCLILDKDLCNASHIVLLRDDVYMYGFRVSSILKPLQTQQFLKCDDNCTDIALQQYDAFF